MTSSTAQSKQNMVQLIASAPLSESDKKELLETLSREGENDSLFRIFNEKLMADFELRKGQYLKAVENLECEFKKIDDTSRIKEEKLSAELETRLTSQDMSDLETREKVFDEYYANQEIVWQDREAVLKDLLASSITNFGRQ